MKQITSAEAKKIAHNANKTSKLSEYLENIEYLAKQGFYDYQVNVPLTEYDREELSILGFKVRTTQLNNDIISWS